MAMRKWVKDMDLGSGFEFIKPEEQKIERIGTVIKALRKDLF